MKTLILLMVLPLLVFAQTTNTITLTLTGVPTAYVKDMSTKWLSLHDTVGALTSPLDGTSDLVTPAVTVSVAPLIIRQTTPATLLIPVGMMLSIGGEPCAVTVTTPLTCARGTVSVGTPPAPLVPLAAHVTGTPVYLLTYPDPWTMVAATALNPWMQRVITELGTQSATNAPIGAHAVVQ